MVVIEHIQAVQIAGGWIDVAVASFRIGEWEFRSDAAHEDAHPLCNLGYGFEFVSKDGHEYKGPVSAIQAVRT